MSASIAEPLADRPLKTPKTPPMHTVPPSTAENATHWRNADEGFWVAAREGSFLGTVDSASGRFSVRNTFAEYLGEYQDLRSAQLRLDEWAAEYRATRRPAIAR